jgi:hypothetical protein
MRRRKTGDRDHASSIVRAENGMRHFTEGHPMIGRKRPLRGLGSFVLVLVLVTPAHAIDCVRGLQSVNGQLISTPYCQDAYLAEVAREYGLKASAAQIRANPNLKKEICRTVFTDNRVQLTCEQAGVPERRN